MAPKITFKTAMGDYQVDVLDTSISMYQLCIFNKIPYQSVNVYLRVNGIVERYVGMHNTIDYITTNQKGVSEIILYSDSNSNYQNVHNKTINIQLKENPSTEYSFQANDNFKQIEHVLLSEQDCKDYIKREVAIFFNKFVSKNNSFDKITKIVVGISGGGDSNALLTSIHSISEEFSLKIYPVMVRGIPGTDNGYKRAIELCKSLNLELIEINESDINSILKRKKKENWAKDFMTIFPGSDVEIIATLVIRKSLFSVAKKIKTRITMLGVNLEDILAESFIRTLQGELPFPFPVRKIGDYEIWFPLFKTPKKIIDGCFPKYSFQNYTERIPNVVAGRDLSLYLAQNMSQVINGIEFDFINGFHKLSMKNKKPFAFQNEINDFVVGEVSNELLYKWRKFMNYVK